MDGVHAFGQPLAQEISVRVEHGDPAVAAPAFTVGDIDVTVLSVDKDAGRHEEVRRARIERRAFDGSVRGIVHALLPDLHEQLAAVMGIFLNHAGRGARDPHIVVRVEMTAVEARHRGGGSRRCFDGFIEQLGISPGVDHFAGGIELDQGRRQAAGVQLALHDVLPIEDEHMILGIDADPAKPPSPSGRAGASAKRHRPRSEALAPMMWTPGLAPRLR